jgi:hypothetical protein
MENHRRCPTSKSTGSFKRKPKKKLASILVIEKLKKISRKNIIEKLEESLPLKEIEF